MSQSQDVSQVLSELTRPQVDHQSRHRPIFKFKKIKNNDLEVAHPLRLVVLRLPDSWLNWNLKMLVFEEREKPGYPEKNLSEEGREPTRNSTSTYPCPPPPHPPGVRVTDELMLFIKNVNCHCCFLNSSCDAQIYIYIYIYIESKLLCRMKILKTMKNASLLCFCATCFTAVAALQA